jgi:predicted nucleic acid-binding protein
MAILVDSSVFIEAERRRLTLADVVALAPEQEELVMSTLTIAELLLGVHLSSPSPLRDQRAAFIEDIVESVRSLSLDEAVARTYSEVWAHLSQTGNLIAPHDLVIGATALTHGFAVLTHNIRDFQRVPGLELIRPGWY